MECYYSGALVIGMLFGIFLIAGMAVFIQKIQGIKFKQYILESKDSVREDIKTDLEEMLSKSKEIAEKTNTMYFKRKTNELIDFICLLEKYRMN